MTNPIYAPGWPGSTPRWTSSAKSGVGTSLNSSSLVWFTLSHGILNEIYYPRLDTPCTRDLGLIVTDRRDFFSEEKRHATSKLDYPPDHNPLYRLTNTCEGSRYRIEKEILTDPRRTAHAFRVATVKLLRPFKARVHTLTLDNGTEGAQHERIAQASKARVYFAHPYASWERGTNGLIRQYFPKHRNLTSVTQHELDHVMHRLNHRPRKRLGFKTPYEIFYRTNTILTVALGT